MSYQIYDWAGNLCFDGKEFPDFDEAECFLCTILDDTYEDTRGEYYIEQVRPRAARYLDPNDPRAKLVRGDK